MKIIIHQQTLPGKDDLTGWWRPGDYLLSAPGREVFFLAGPDSYQNVFPIVAQLQVPNRVNGHLEMECYVPPHKDRRFTGLSHVKLELLEPEYGTTPNQMIMRFWNSRPWTVLFGLPRVREHRQAATPFVLEDRRETNQISYRETCVECTCMSGGAAQ
jgi:hypothetical protein